MFASKWLLGVALIATAPALAQNYPTKPIRIIVPFGAGGANDVVVRIVATRMTEVLGQHRICSRVTSWPRRPTRKQRSLNGWGCSRTVRPFFSSCCASRSSSKEPKRKSFA